MPTSPDPALLQRIATRVKTRRGVLGWTMAEAAEAAGLSPRFYAQVEAAQANIAIGRLDALARALQVSLISLLEDGASTRSGGPGIREVAPPLGIALLGIRGSGKSTLGASLADALELPFLELDAAIEDRAGLALSELFALHGENYYRRLGGETIEQLIGEGTPHVVALPGGIVLDEYAFELVSKNFTTVWLRTEPEDCMNRVLAQGDHRPMQGHEDAMAELRKLLAAREPYYRRASLTLDTSAADLVQTQAHLLQTVQDARLTLAE